MGTLLKWVRRPAELSGRRMLAPAGCPTALVATGLRSGAPLGPTPLARQRLGRNRRVTDKLASGRAGNI